MNIPMKRNKPIPTTDKRTCYVGAKVTPLQQDTIRKIATRCSMTVSDYLLARSHDYEPKQRLTSRQTESLATLNDCRSDIINYTSALRGMNAAKRKQLFNDHACMLGWLKQEYIDTLDLPEAYKDGTLFMRLLKGCGIEEASEESTD